MVDFRRLEDVNVSGKRVLVRVDFNVPCDDTGKITDDTRLRAALPTLAYLRDKGAKIILLSHYGRPDGVYDAGASLEKLVPSLSDLIGIQVHFASDCIGPKAQSAVDALQAGDVLLLENTRFHMGEAKTADGQKGYDPAFAKAMADLAEIFVHDAFSVCHRAQASTSGIGDILTAYAGLALERELDHISQALDIPKKPVMGLVGGAKVSSKIDLLKNLVGRLDCLAIGGGMANTFLAALGHNVGNSLCEHDLRETALEILENAKLENCEILLPVDVIAATGFAAHAPHRVCGLDDVKSDEMILDAGPDTVTNILDAMDRCRTLIWNGPLGAFELPPFDTATVEAAKYAAKRVKNNGLIAVAGGGDTVAALKHAGAADGFTFISTAGGAFLEWMEGKALPGIEMLKKEL
ncbi:MAG: phosphoglycerate kinase [Robiginitomaculum sp.]|nr:MAG: phosphoglycerate kinase [Robiginitomaculum sp.]